MKEDKQKICDALLGVFKLTRERDNIVSLEYDIPTETVRILYASGFAVLVNVALDSGMAMISDIMKQIKY